MVIQRDRYISSRMHVYHTKRRMGPIICGYASHPLRVGTARSQRSSHSYAVHLPQRHRHTTYADIKVLKLVHAADRDKPYAPSHTYTHTATHTSLLATQHIPSFAPALSRLVCEMWVCSPVARACAIALEFSPGRV